MLDLPQRRVLQVLKKPSVTVLREPLRPSVQQNNSVVPSDVGTFIDGGLHE
jgi:hypothetical protein